MNPHSIRRYVEKEPGRWELLERALKEPRDAFSTKQEWLIDVFDKGRVVRKAEFNYQEIFRGNSPEQMLDRIELALEGDQEPSIDYLSHPISFMGGVRHYLGRNPNHFDVINLVVLRDLTMVWDTEWLAEVSVIVIKQEA